MGFEALDDRRHRGDPPLEREARESTQENATARVRLSGEVEQVWPGAVEAVRSLIERGSHPSR
jgi:hypothetical protein